MKNYRIRTVLACVSLMAVGLTLSSCTMDTSIPGLDDFQVAWIQDSFVMTFTAPNLQLDGGITVPIPDLPGATVGLAPNVQSSGTVFEFSVPLSAITGNQNFYAESGLPDGRPLPDVASGTMPRFDLTAIAGLPISFYLSDQGFAVFIPLSFDGISIDWPWELSASIVDESGNLVGTIYLVPSDADGQGSGLFVLIPITPDTAAPSPSTSHSIL